MKNYNLTEKQQQGLDIAWRRYCNNDLYTIIAGYAGTGKSYLVNAIVDQFEFVEGEIAFATYTGKAANVLRQQGKNAITLHKLLYTAKPNGYGGFTFHPKENLEENYKLIIVDEISMCPKEMWQLLLKHKVYIIGLGDPFQLGPISADTDNHLLDNPHIFLTEVMRQALDNDIIKYSLELREGKDLPVGLEGKNIRTYSKDKFSTGMMKWADQILCGKNETRRIINNKMREILGYKDLINLNEKMICLKNYWEKTSSKGEALVNGYIGIVLKNNVNEFTGGETIDFGTEEDYFKKIKVDQLLLKDGISAEQRYWNKCNGLKYSEKKKIEKPAYVELDYGYAITVHKAQGSQFGRVLVYDEIMGDELSHRRWLYTAITRAIDEVVVLL